MPDFWDEPAGLMNRLLNRDLWMRRAVLVRLPRSRALVTRTYLLRAAKVANALWLDCRMNTTA